MHEAQAKGYYLEEIVRELMRDSHLINVQTGNIEGRGADHQIDSYGTLMFSLPFVYPVRLISEVKWFKEKYLVELNRLRDFVGVLLDISQNYFVPRSLRSSAHRDQRRERYTDCGAYFSATGFSLPAQDYAWAHGVYLISFSQDPILEPILTRAKELITENEQVWNYFGAKKSDVIGMAKSHFKNDTQLRQRINETRAYFGILDELYPVMIITDGEFRFNPTQPDTLTEEELPLNSAIKERRRESEIDVNFQFRFKDNQFSFSLPRITSQKIIRGIESTYGGQAFGFIDIPLVLFENELRYRRIFRIQLRLPEEIKINLR